MWLMWIATGLAAGSEPDSADTARPTTELPSSPLAPPPETTSPRLPEVPVESLKIKRQVEPEYPPDATGMTFGRQACRARVVLDRKSKVVEVAISNCPEVYHRAAKEAVRASRYRLPKDDRYDEGGEVDLSVLFEPPRP